MAVAETSMTTNGISIAILTVALLTTLSALFGIFSGFVPSFELRHTFLSVVLTIQIAIWLFLTMFELTEVKDIGSKENSYNSSFWGNGSGLSHGCSWADSGRYRDKDSYNKTCSLVKARFSISWVVLILLSTIFFSFLFGPKRISDGEKEKRRRQSWRDKGKGVEGRVAGQEGGVAGQERGATEQEHRATEQEHRATEQAIEGDSITPIGRLAA